MGTATQDKSKGKKSGIKTFKPGDVLFHENDIAESLFIIQTGQVRLYRPKGRGFVDIAILRAGEVIGEMAYFDEKSRRRSCSAASIVTTEVVEISFNAFAKTIQNLNPWFKTIINTLAERLRKTNERVKALESNSVGFAKEGKVADYVFFHTTDIMKILSTLYLVIRNHGEKQEGHWEIHTNKLKFYLFDVYNVSEIKYEEFLNLLKAENYVSMAKDGDGLAKLMRVRNPDSFRAIAVFFNTQRLVEDAKKLKISAKCETFLGKILAQLDEVNVDKPKWPVDISIILEDFKAQNISIIDADLRDAVDSGLAEDILVGEGNKLTSIVNYEKLKQIFPAIRMMNAVQRINQTKAKNS